MSVMAHHTNQLKYHINKAHLQPGEHLLDYHHFEEQAYGTSEANSPQHQVDDRSVSMESAVEQANFLASQMNPYQQSLSQIQAQQMSVQPQMFGQNQIQSLPNRQKQPSSQLNLPYKSSIINSKLTSKRYQAPLKNQPNPAVQKLKRKLKRKPGDRTSGPGQDQNRDLSIAETKAFMPQMDINFDSKFDLKLKKYEDKSRHLNSLKSRMPEKPATIEDLAAIEQFKSNAKKERDRKLYMEKHKIQERMINHLGPNRGQNGQDEDDEYDDDDENYDDDEYDYSNDQNEAKVQKNNYENMNYETQDLSDEEANYENNYETLDLAEDYSAEEAENNDFNSNLNQNHFDENGESHSYGDRYGTREDEYEMDAYDGTNM